MFNKYQMEEKFSYFCRASQTPTFANTLMNV